MDIKKRKPRVINLKKMKKVVVPLRSVAEPVKIEVVERVVAANIEPFTAKCIKCRQDFQSTDKTDEDGQGHCPPCKAERLSMLEKIEANHQARWQNKSQPKSFNERYPFVNGTGFIRAKDMGL